MTVYALSSINDLQSTINAAAPGDTIMLPAATLSIPAGIIYIDGITIAGQTGTIVAASGIGGAFDFSGRSGITLRDITFTLQNSASAVKASGADHITIDNLSITSNFHTADSQSIGGIPIHLSNSSFINVTNSDLLHTFGGVYLVDCTDSSVSDNSIVDLGFGGVNITGARITVTGNTITNPGTSSTDGQIGGGDGITVGAGNDITLSGNAITGGTCYQINVAGAVTNMSVTNNVMRGAHTSSMYFIDVRQLQLSGNDFKDGHWLGVTIEVGSGILIEQNRFEEAAVWLAADVWDTEVSGNVFVDAGAGVVGVASLYDSNIIEFAAGHLPELVPVVAISAGGQARLTSVLSAAGLDQPSNTAFHLLDADVLDGSASVRVGGFEVDPRAGILTLASGQVATTEVGGAQASHHEILWFSAYDGHWSEWQQVVLRTVDPGYFGNRAPLLDSLSLSLAPGSRVPARSALFGFDEDDDEVTTYHLLSSAATADGAQLYLDGAAVAHGSIVTVYASELRDPHHLTIGAGTIAGTHVFHIRASDGSAWSDWKSITLTTEAQGSSANLAPTVLTDVLLIAPGTSARVAEQVRGFDTDGGNITFYRVLQSNTSAASAAVVSNALVLDGTAGALTLTASEFSTVTIKAGSGPLSEIMWVQAYDGETWSDWVQLTVTTVASGTLGNLGPSVLEKSAVLAATATVKASELIETFDREGDAPISFHFLSANVAPAELLLNGVLHDIKLGMLTVSPANLDQLVFATGDFDQSYLYVQAYDGHSWGDWARITLIGTGS